MRKRSREMRYGVRLGPIKARILDHVLVRPGVTTRELDRLVFGGTGEPNAFDNVRAHVHQINATLAHVGVAIVGKSGQGFRVVERKAAVAA